MLKGLALISFAIINFANSLGMNLADKKQLIDSRGDSYKESACLIMQMPNEILTSIIGFCMRDASNTDEFKKTILYLGQINRLFKQLMTDRQILTFAGKILESMQSNFYKNNNLLYKPADFGIKNGLQVLSRAALLNYILNFSKNKHENVEKINKKPGLLLEGAYEGDIEKIVLTLSNGFLVDEKDIRGNTALQIASYNGKRDIVEFLLSIGAKIDEKRYTDGVTALTCAIFAGHKEIAQLLLEKGAKANGQDNEGKTGLMLLARKKEEFIGPLIKLLISYGADVNEKNNKGQTPLMIAIECSNYPAIEVLLADCANLTEKDNDLPMFMAVKAGNKEMVLFLLKNGMHIDAKDNKGWTALMHTAASGDEKMTKLLLDHGAKINEKDNEGNSVLDIAKLYTLPSFDIVKLLERRRCLVM